MFNLSSGRLRAALVLSLAAFGFSAAAQGFPTRPIEIVTHSGVGGGGDVMGRQVIEVARDLFPQPLVMVNKAGAAGRNLENHVKDKAPDGHTLVVTVATQLLYLYGGSISMNINKDLRPIIRLQVEPTMVAVKKDSPYRNMQEIIAAAKAGKVTFGGGPVGGPEYLFFHKLSKDNGFKLNYVAYGGAGDMMMSLLGGSMDVTLLQTAESADQLKAGAIRYLGVASAQRIPVAELKDVPTLREQGVDFVFEHWRGLHTHASVPDSVVEYLHARFKQATERPAWKKWMADTGQVQGYMAPPEFKAFAAEQERVIRTIMTDAGLNKRKP